MVEEGREGKEMGWLAAQKFLGLLFIDRGIPASLGDHLLPRNPVGHGRLNPTNLPPAFWLHDFVYGCWGQISPLTLHFVIHKMWRELMGQWNIVLEARRPRS